MLLFPAALVAAVPADPVRTAHQAQDFDQVWTFLRARYAWPERIRWEGLRAGFRTRAIAAENDGAFLRILEELLEQLGDAHTHLGMNFDDSWWLPPADLVAEWEGKQAVITQVQRDSTAWKAGVRPGMGILGIGGESLAQALLVRQPRFLAQPSSDVDRWTLNTLLAGRRQARRRLKLQVQDQEVDFDLLPAEPAQAMAAEAQLLPGEIGYIGFRHFGDMAQAKRMDQALAAFPNARAWILDVRNNGGGDTAVICHIMGRFLKAKACYAWMAKRQGEALGPLWPEYVKPRGKTFEGPVALVVDGSTMSVAEGLAMGMQGLGRGLVVGLPMAGLGAAVHSETLKHSRVRVQISTEPVYDTQKQPRNSFRPAYPVNLASPENLLKNDPILDAALTMLRSNPAAR